MTYTSRVDRNHPACLIFLVDQSDSMEDAIGGDTATPKQVAVADILNGLLYELILRSVKNPQEGPRPYFAVSILGYHTDPEGAARVVKGLRPPLDAHDVAWTPELASNPLRVDRVPAPSGTGVVSRPVWIEPRAEGGTPMFAALDRAGRIARSWVDDHPDSFPPIVFNLTDGESTDGPPHEWASRLRSLSSADGRLLLFNLNLSGDASAPLLFPSDADALPGEAARSLFDMSSELPPFMLEAARAQGHEVRDGARGFGFNADIRAVMTFLNVGTSVGKALR